MNKENSKRLMGWKYISWWCGGISVSTAKRWEGDGLPVYRIKARVYAKKDDIDRWLDSHCKKSALR